MKKLEEIRARAEKVTLGPWEIDPHDTTPLESINSTADPRIGGWVEVARSVGADAEFIAHSRTDVPKLVAALEAVLGLANQAEPFTIFGGATAPGIVGANQILTAIQEALQ